MTLKSLRGVAGRVEATDEEILSAYKNGMFLNQIRNHFKVGLPRLRKIVREYEIQGVDA